MRYITRNHAFAPTTMWVIDGGSLRLEQQAAPPVPPRVVPLVAIAQVRLEFAPTRFEPRRFRCRLTLHSGETLEFFNRTYAGLADFRDTSAAYRDFVGALHDALAARAELAPGRGFVAGSTAGAYAASAAGLGVALVALAVAALLLIATGLWWLLIVKLAVIALSVPVAMRWMQRNRPRPYDPAAIPAEVLPGP